MFGLEELLGLQHRLQHHFHVLLAIKFLLGIAAVVARATIIFLIFLTEVVEQQAMAAHGRLGVGHRLVQQLTCDFLFGDVFALVEFLKFMDILIIIESNAIPLASVTTGAARLLVITFKALGDVVMDNEAHIRFVDTHAEGDGGDNHIHFLHQEFVLILFTGLAIESCVIRECLDAVHHQSFGQFLHFFTAEAIHDARLSLVLLDIFDDILDDVFGFGTHLVIKVGAVERRFEDLGIHDFQVLHDVVLHFDGGRGGESDDGQVFADGVDDGTQAAVFGPEVVSPFRDTVCLVDGHERDFEGAKEVHSLFFGQRLGSHIQHLGLTVFEVFFHLQKLRFRERGVHHMGDTQLGTEVADHIHLVFHQGDQGRDHDGGPRFHQSRQLVAQRFATPRGHQHKSVVPR